MGLQYHVKKIERKEQIEHCEKFFINQYMWNSKQSPLVYGWMGYVEGEGLFVKMVCEEKNPLRRYYRHNDPVYTDSAMEIFLAFPEENRHFQMNVCIQILRSMQTVQCLPIMDAGEKADAPLAKSSLP